MIDGNLYSAARHGRLDSISVSAFKREDWLSPDESNNNTTALHWAAFWGELNVVPEAIRADRSAMLTTDITGDSIIQWAARYGHIHQVPEHLHRELPDAPHLPEMKTKTSAESPPISILKNACITSDKFDAITKMRTKGILVPNGLSSGYRDLDCLTDGFQKSEVIIVASRPSLGKTDLAHCFIEAACLPRRGTGVPVLLFTYEMTAGEITKRMLCSRAKFSRVLARDGLLSKNGEETVRLNSASVELANMPLLICDNNDLNIEEIRQTARAAHAQHPLRLIVIDYVQLIPPTKESKTQPRDQQIAEISRGLKAMAKELEVTVIVLCQLNRASDKTNRSPELTDLRDSGSLEEDADVVMIIEQMKHTDRKYCADSVQLIIAKQRNGPVGKIYLTYLKDINRFENYTQ